MRINRTDILVRKARIASGNSDYDDSYGIDDEPFIQSLCDAQIELQAAIVDEEACAFVAYKELQIVANQESYDVPADAFVDNLVYGVQYSRSGLAKDYCDLEDGGYRESTYAGLPDAYVVDAGQIHLTGVPPGNTGSLRIRYEKGLDKLDKRRGTVTGTTIGASYRYPLTIVLDADSDSASLELAEYVCVNDKFGTVKMRNIPIASWDASTYTINVDSSFVAESEETAVAAGDFITIGEDTTTHSKLLYICEPYLINAASLDSMRLHSSTDSTEQSEKLARFMKRIINTYQKIPGGKQQIIERRW